LKRLTASKLPLFKACQYPWRDEVTWIEDRGGEAATRGQAIHAEIEEALLGGFGVTDTVEWIRSAAMSPFEYAASTLKVEHALGWNASEAIVYELPKVNGRDYPEPGENERWVFGTADVIIETENEIRVIDWKTGKREFVGPAYESEQLRFLAAAYVAADPAREGKTVTLELWFVGEEKFVDVAVWDPGTHLNDLWARIKRVDHAEPKPGDGCKFCPARVSCPAINNALAVRDRVPTTALAIVDDRHAEQLLQLKKLAYTFAEHLEKITKEWTDTHGEIALENGKRYRPTQSTYTTTNTGAVVELARALGASDEQLASCERDSVRRVYRETR